MSNRTFQIYGYSYGTSSATMEVTVDGNVVYSGEVAYTSQSDPAPNVQTEPICSFEMPIDWYGTVPMTCTVNSGSVVFAQILGNYDLVYNPVYTTQEAETLLDTNTPTSELIPILSAHANPPFSSEDITFLETNSRSTWKPLLTQHNALVKLSSGPNSYGVPFSGDPRTNVVIDGAPQTPSTPGTVWWKIDAGSTMAYTFNAEPAFVG